MVRHCKTPDIFWTEVVQFSEVYFVKSKSNAAITNVCKPAVDRWKKRFELATQDYEKHKRLYDHAKSVNDPTFIANAETDMKAAKNIL